MKPSLLTQRKLQTQPDNIYMNGFIPFSRQVSDCENGHTMISLQLYCISQSKTRYIVQTCCKKQREKKVNYQPEVSSAAIIIIITITITITITTIMIIKIVIIITMIVKTTKNNKNIRCK